MISGIAEAPPAGLGKLLIENRFCVPSHQRDYSWTEDEIKQFFDDIDSAIAEKEESYFVGLMVFMQPDESAKNEELIVLDGQQRLATAIIFISAVRNWLAQYTPHQKDANQMQDWFIGRSELGETEPLARLILNSANNQTFSDYIVNSIPIDEIKTALQKLKRQDRNRKLLEAALYCRDRVAEIATNARKPDETARRLIKIVRYLQDNVSVARLMVSSDGAAFTIFETLNDRGLDLSPLDLLKNYLFKRAEQHSKPRIRDMESRWTQMMATLANVKANQFLKVFWTSRHGRIQRGSLYDALKLKYNTPTSAVDFSVDMLAASEQYAALETADDPVWAPYSKKAREYVRNLRLLSGQQVHPVMLAGLNRFSVTDLERLLKLLEIIVVRYQLVGGERTGRLEISCARLAKMIYDKQIKNASMAFKELKDVYPSDDEFKTAFQIKQERNNQKAQYLLRGIEIQERQLAGNMSKEEEPANLTVEHILPKNPGSDWTAILKADDTLLEDCLYRIGNLCLLTTDNNKEIGAAGIDQKKKIYAASKIILTKQLVTVSTWNRQAIDKRQVRMAKLATSVWRFQ
jgi:hypothetical protein